MIQMEYRNIDELCELERNPRTISKKQFDTLKKSLQDNPDYFEARPIILSNRTGKFVIIAGNQRYKAAKALKMDKVPTVLLEGLTEEREREIVIRDNVANGEWDYEILANEWDAGKLGEWGIENIKSGIKDEKNIEEAPPTITASFITFDYSDEIQLEISEKIAQELMADMIKYQQANGTYNGYWDRRLANE